MKIDELGSPLILRPGIHKVFTKFLLRPTYYPYVEDGSMYTRSIYCMSIVNRVFSSLNLSIVHSAKRLEIALADRAQLTTFGYTEQ